MSIPDKTNWSSGPTVADVKRSWARLFKDLGLFASLQIARLIVWRTLWRGRLTKKYKMN